MSNQRATMINGQRPARLQTEGLAINGQSKHFHSSALWVAFTAVILIAFFFRFYRLADHPLGIFFDPAINGLDAVRLMQRGGPVIFFPTNGGREAPFMYLLIPYIWLFGTTPFSLRALTATISLLNVALVFAFLYDRSCTVQGSKGRYQKSNRIWLAALGSLVLAVSYWHIAVSRLGQRPILVPMLSVPLFWFFLKGWATGHRKWFVLSGLFMGLEGYTYSAARLLPVILILAVLPDLLPSLRQEPIENKREKQYKLTLSPKDHYFNLLIFLCIAMVICSPLAWYFVNHPVQFTGRAFSVTVWHFLDTPTAIIAELGRNALRIAGFFCCVGSPNPIFGLLDVPGLPLLLTPFLLVGLFSALKNWPDLFHRLVFIWWIVGVFASIVAIEAPHPLRMIVGTVPTAILVGLGLIQVADWIQQQVSPSQDTGNTSPARWARPIRSSQHIWRWVAVALLLATTPGFYQAYFVAWTKLQSTQGVYDYGAIAIRDEIVDQVDGDVALYLPFARFNDSPLLFYLSGSFQRRASLSVSPASHALVISPQKNVNDIRWVQLQNNVATILPPMTTEGQQLIRTALNNNPIKPILTTSGETVAVLAELPTDPAQFLQEPIQLLSASFGPVRLTGANFAEVIDPLAGELPVTLYWQANQQMTDEFEVLLRLVDDQRRGWGNGDARPNDWVYPTTFWRPSLDRISDHHVVVLDSDSPGPGRYWLALSVFHPATGKRLPLAANVSDSPDTFFMGPLKVPLAPPPFNEDNEGAPLATFADVVHLTRFEADQLTITAGEPVRFGLLWEALTRPDRDYTVFTHLLDANGNLVAGHDTQPVTGSYPTTIWSPGERILDPHTLPTNASLPAGQYRLAIGLYYQPTGERLPLTLADGRQDQQGRLILTQPVQVK